MLKEVGPTELDEVLQRMEASATFERSVGLLRLLRFLVENAETNGQGLKETYIGTTFYNRDATYDPRYDSIVRVNTKRLRERLARYYAEEGADDPLQVSVPIGSYAPVILRRSLPEPDPAEEEVAAALDFLDASLDQANRVNTAAPRFARRKVIVLALAVEIVVGFVVAFFLRMPGHRVEPGFVAGNFEEVPLTMGRDLEFEPSTSRNGQRLAYVSRSARSGPFHIFVRSFVPDGKGERVLSTGAENALYPAWSPDGKQMAFLRCGMGPCDIATVPVNGGPVSVVRNLPTYTLPDDQPYYQFRQLNPVWTADGKGIIYPYRGLEDNAERLVLQNLATGATVQLTSGEVSDEDGAPALSPDGRSVAFLRRHLSQTEVMSVDLKTRKEQVLETEPDANTSGLTWSPDGSGVVVGIAHRGIYALRWIPLHGQPKQLDVKMPIVMNPVFSRDGKSLMVLQVNRSRNLAEMTDGAHEATPVFQSKQRNTFNALSPDASRLAFLSDRSGTFELWTSVRQGTSFLQPRQLTRGLGWYPSSVSWSPDGRMLAVGISNTNQIDIVDARSGAISLLRLPGLEHCDTWNPVWSSDGRWIYLSAWGEKNGIFRASTGPIPSVEQVMNGRVREIRMDGSRALYFEPNYGRGIYRIALDGSDPRPQPIPQLSDVLPARAWTVTEGKIDYFDVHDPLRRFHQFDPASGTITEITEPIPRVAFNDGTISYLAKAHLLIYSEWTEAAGSQIIDLRWH